MRRSLACLLVTALAACGGGSERPTDASDGSVEPDAVIPPPERGFQIVTPLRKVAPHTQVSYCYYFRTPNTTDMVVKRWASTMAPGAYHLATYLTDTEDMPDDTLTTKPCGFGDDASGTKQVLAYVAKEPKAELALPSDDGTGTPVGQAIKAGQAGYIQMHYDNTTDQELQVNVVLNAYAYDEGVAATLAAPFITFTTDILVKPGSEAAPTTAKVGASCIVPLIAGQPPKFFRVTTHTHKQGVRTSIEDGGTALFESTSWQRPGNTSWPAPYYTFSSGKLTYQCEYANPNPLTLETGFDPKIHEQCMVIGYFFPSPDGKGHLCVDGGGVY